MKKALILLIMMAGMLAAPALADDLGNPAQLLQPGHSNFGVSGDYIILQRFKDVGVDSRSTTTGESYQYLSENMKEQSQFMATATYGVLDWLNIFGRFGVIDGGKLTTHNLSTGAEWQGRYYNDFVWAAGAKALLWEAPGPFGPGFMITGQYLRYDDRKVSEWKQTSGPTYDAESLYYVQDEIKYYWQTDVVATAYWTCRQFKPYVGAGVSYSEAKFTGSWTNNAGTSRTDYDYYVRNNDVLLTLVGCDVNLGCNFKLNLQADFIARDQVSLGLSYNF